MRRLFGGAAFLIFCYGLLPTLLQKYFYKPKAKGGLLLSFDDGPEAITGELLQLLKEHEIKALFFVLEEQTLRYPEFLLQMKEEGHLIGLHGRDHRSNWSMSPFHLYRELEHQKRKLQEKGIEVSFYRPPFGRVTWASFFLCRTLDVRLLGWSHLLGDWKTMKESDLREKLERAEGEGHVLLLHDGGKGSAVPGANERMLRVLKEWIPDYRRRGGHFSEVLE